jgi:hypothetical protein
MRVLRKGGKFTDSRIRFYSRKAIVFCILGLLVVLFSLYGNSPQIGLIAVAMLVVLFKINVRRWQSWSCGKMGESAVTRALCRLPDEYVLLNDLMLPDGKGNVDHLVIGPSGLFVIETKNYSGNVKCDRDDWFVNGKKIGSLSRQAKRNAMAIRANLEKIFVEQQIRIPFVNALLVFTSRRGRLNLNQPTVPVLRSFELARFIRNYESSGRRTEGFSSELTRSLVHHLHLLQQKPDALLHKNQLPRVLMAKSEA